MSNAILTPVTLWRDFNDDLPLDEEMIFEMREENVIKQQVFFSGRQTKEGRVRIYAELYSPEEEKFPAVMILFEAGTPFDREFVRRFTDKGYGVLCVDYCGDKGTQEPCTVYPSDVDYGNFLRADRRMTHVDTDASETSWYEWAAVARYAYKYLSTRPAVTSVGAIGLRTGGEVLFKVVPFVPVSCFVSVCAAGWLAYDGMERFGEVRPRGFDDERHRFIAGVDSQSYAPYITCPALLLATINDKKYNYERVYDTFRQLRPDIEKAILFSAHGNGLMGSHSLLDIELFLDKYLKGRSVFVSKPVDVTIGEDGEGRLVANGIFDDEGEIKDFGIFYTEKVEGSRARDWTRVLGKREDLKDNVGTVPLTLYKGCKRALVYAFVNYSNNFSMTSKICDFTVEKEYPNTRLASRVIYTNAEGCNGFTGYCLGAKTVADCFHAESETDVKLLPGYGGIEGITSDFGMISYRVGEHGYGAPPSASFGFDAWCPEKSTLRVTFFLSDDEKGYTCEIHIDGGGKWKNILLDASDFKQEGGPSLDDFEGVHSVMFVSEERVLINNVLWY